LLVGGMTRMPMVRTLVSQLTKAPVIDDVNPDEREGFTPRPAMLRPEDVAAAVLFVVSQPASVNVDELRVSRT